MPNMTMQQAARNVLKAVNEQRSVMVLANEAEGRSGTIFASIAAGDYAGIRRRGSVTDSAIGEAAYRKLNAIECALALK